jgi:hypothetical protein
LVKKNDEVTSEKTGRVEILSKGEWKSVCTDDLTDEQASKLCTYMNYDSGTLYKENE